MALYAVQSISNRIKLAFYSMNRRGKAITKEDALLYDQVTKIQTKILGKLAQIKKQKPNLCCKHFQNLKDRCGLYQPSNNYYQNYWKLFLLNELCIAKLQESNSALNKLEQKVAGVETLFEQHQQLLQGKWIKRNRRFDFQVDKNHHCPYPSCFRNYATEVSLNLHIKLKHNGGSKTQRKRAAEMVWAARRNNEPIPHFYINLPPGFLQEYRQNHQANNQANIQANIQANNQANNQDQNSREDESESRLIQNQSQDS